MDHSFTPKFAQILLLLACMLAALTGHSSEKPNMPLIWGDDAGWFSISASNHDLMGLDYRKRKIDRIGWMRLHQAASINAVRSGTGQYQPDQKGLKGAPRQLSGACPARAGDDTPRPGIHCGSRPTNKAIAQG